MCAACADGACHRQQLQSGAHPLPHAVQQRGEEAGDATTAAAAAAAPGGARIVAPDVAGVSKAGARAAADVAQVGAAVEPGVAPDVAVAGKGCLSCQVAPLGLASQARSHSQTLLAWHGMAWPLPASTWGPQRQTHLSQSLSLGVLDCCARAACMQAFVDAPAHLRAQGAQGGKLA